MATKTKPAELETDTLRVIGHNDWLCLHYRTGVNQPWELLCEVDDAPAGREVLVDALRQLSDDARRLFMALLMGTEVRR